MQDLIQLITAFIGSLGFAILFNIRGKKLIYAALGGLLSWAVYLGAGLINENPYFCGFLATIVTTFYGEIMARVFKSPVTVFLVSATIPLIPGAALYRTMSNLMAKNYSGFSAEGIYTLLFATSMAAGMTVTTVLFRLVWGSLHQGRSLHIR